MSPIRIAKIETKKLTPPNGDQDAEKLNHLYIVMRMQSAIATLENSWEIS